MESENIMWTILNDYLYFCKLAMRGWIITYKTMITQTSTDIQKMELDSIIFEEEYLKRPQITYRNRMG